MRSDGIGLGVSAASRSHTCFPGSHVTRFVDISVPSIAVAYHRQVEVFPVAGEHAREIIDGIKRRIERLIERAASQRRVITETQTMVAAERLY